MRLAAGMGVSTCTWSVAGAGDGDDSGSGIATGAGRGCAGGGGVRLVDELGGGGIGKDSELYLGGGGGGVGRGVEARRGVGAGGGSGGVCLLSRSPCSSNSLSHVSSVKRQRRTLPARTQTHSVRRTRSMVAADLQQLMLIDFDFSLRLCAPACDGNLIATVSTTRDRDATIRSFVIKYTNSPPQLLLSTSDCTNAIAFFRVSNIVPFPAVSDVAFGGEGKITTCCAFSPPPSLLNC